MKRVCFSRHGGSVASRAVFLVALFCFWAGSLSGLASEGAAQSIPTEIVLYFIEEVIPELDNGNDYLALGWSEEMGPEDQVEDAGAVLDEESRLSPPEKAAFLFMVDRFPGAEWAHPVVYVWVFSDGSGHQTIPSEWWLELDGEQLWSASVFDEDRTDWISWRLLALEYEQLLEVDESQADTNAVASLQPLLLPVASLQAGGGAKVPDSSQGAVLVDGFNNKRGSDKDNAADRAREAALGRLKDAFGKAGGNGSVKEVPLDGESEARTAQGKKLAERNADAVDRIAKAVEDLIAKGKTEITLVIASHGSSRKGGTMHLQGDAKLSHEELKKVIDRARKKNPKVKINLVMTGCHTGGWIKKMMGYPGVGLVITSTSKAKPGLNSFRENYAIDYSLLVARALQTDSLRVKLAKLGEAQKPPVSWQAIALHLALYTSVQPGTAEARGVATPRSSTAGKKTGYVNKDKKTITPDDLGGLLGDEYLARYGGLTVEKCGKWDGRTMTWVIRIVNSSSKEVRGKLLDALPDDQKRKKGESDIQRIVGVKNYSKTHGKKKARVSVTKPGTNVLQISYQIPPRGWIEFEIKVEYKSKKDDYDPSYYKNRANKLVHSEGSPAPRITSFAPRSDGSPLLSGSKEGEEESVYMYAPEPTAGWHLYLGDTYGADRTLEFYQDLIGWVADLPLGWEWSLYEHSGRAWLGMAGAEIEDPAIVSLPFIEVDDLDVGTMAVASSSPELRFPDPQEIVAVVPRTRSAEVIEGVVETDDFDDAWAEITLSFPPLIDREIVTFTGPAVVDVFFGEVEGTAEDTDGDGLDQVVLQIADMELAGESALLGPMVLRSSSSMGEIEETENLTSGVLDLAPFGEAGVATSWLDLCFELELLDPPEFVDLFAPKLFLLHNSDPVHMTATIGFKPAAAGDAFQAEGTVNLLDGIGSPTAMQIGPVTLVLAPSVEESVRRWARAVWEHELPLCWTLSARERLCRGLAVEVLLEKLDTYVGSDAGFITPLLHLDASIISGYLEHATTEELEELACLFATTYLEAKPCKQGSPCSQD